MNSAKNSFISSTFWGERSGYVAALTTLKEMKRIKSWKIILSNGKYLIKEISRLGKNDAIFILSVGGGNLKKKVSTNLVQAIKYAKKIKSKVFGIVGRDGGFTKQNGNSVIVIPNIDPKLTTPFAEAYQAVIWHCLVSHPLLQKVNTKW